MASRFVSPTRICIDRRCSFPGLVRRSAMLSRLANMLGRLVDAQQCFKHITNDHDDGDYDDCVWKFFNGWEVLDGWNFNGRKFLKGWKFLCGWKFFNGWKILNAWKILASSVFVFGHVFQQLKIIFLINLLYKKYN